MVFGLLHVEKKTKKVQIQLCRSGACADSYAVITD
jgi:hypothetical protein